MFSELNRNIHVLWLLSFGYNIQSFHYVQCLRRPVSVYRSILRHIKRGRGLCRARHRKELYHSVDGTVETHGLRHLLNNTTYNMAPNLITLYTKMATLFDSCQSAMAHLTVTVQKSMVTIENEVSRGQSAELNRQIDRASCR